MLNVNLRGTLDVIEMGISMMRRLQMPSSIVITSSATAYSLEYLLPVYSASKLALGLY